MIESYTVRFIAEKFLRDAFAKPDHKTIIEQILGHDRWKEYIKETHVVANRLEVLNNITSKEALEVFIKKSAWYYVSKEVEKMGLTAKDEDPRPSA